MQTVIGLGGIAVRVAKCFSEYPQYNIICIDDELTGYDEEYLIPKQASPELYEESFKRSPSGFKEKVKEAVLFIVSGTSLVSSISLRLLRPLILAEKKIKILYIKTESSLLSEVKRMQDKVIFSVLQEYTRSGVFSEMTLVENEMVDKLIEDASITEYYPTINKLISSSYHMIQVFENQNAVVSNIGDIIECRRINTIGTLSKNNEENMFFNIDIPMDVRLYYGITEKSLKKDKDLQRNIINHIKENNQELCKYSYGVYETKYEDNFCFVKTYTSKVQDI